MRVSKLVYDKIKELRKKNGWSQAELARRAKISPSAICQMEKGERLPSLIVVKKASDAFNVSIVELLDLSDSDKEKIDILIQRSKKEDEHG